MRRPWSGRRIDQTTCEPLLAGIVMFALSFGWSTPSAADSAAWLPRQAKLHCSVADYPAVQPRFEETGVGRLIRAEAMQPFFDELPKQLRSQAEDNLLGLIWVDVGVDWSRLEEAVRGEVAWAVFEMQGQPASVLCAEIAQDPAAWRPLEEDIATEMRRQGAELRSDQAADVEITICTFPASEASEASEERDIAFFSHEGWFVASESATLARLLVARVGKTQPDSLQADAAYQHVMEPCETKLQYPSDVRIYAVPFDCLDLMKRVAQEKDREGEFDPEIYRSQGFDALAAVGAAATVGEAGSDFRFFAFGYAPRPWTDSMKMVRGLHNAKLQLQPWISSRLAACCALSLRSESVYRNMGPFFDEVVAGGAEGAWEDILVALREDEYGPKLDLEKEVFAFLDDRAYMLEEEQLPVTPQSPQVLLAIRSSDESALQVGIRKAMQDDPYVKKKDVEGVTCYYAVPQDGQEQPEQKTLWILCVTRGYLLMASDFQILSRVIGGDVGLALMAEKSYAEAKSRWHKQLGAELSTTTFYRLDRWAQVRYELLRQGLRVDPGNGFGGMISSFLGGEPLEAAPPSLDGSKLPRFQAVEQHFGNFGAATITREDGWLLYGEIFP